MATYGEVRFRVASRVPGVSLDLIDGFILDRYAAILDRLNWRRQQVAYPLTTEAGTAIYALPGDARLLHSARYPASPLGLEKWSLARLNQEAPDRAATGQPRIWVPTSDSADDPPVMQIELYPVPDAAYELLVLGTSDPASSASTATSLVPWMRPAALVAGASADALEARTPPDYNAADRLEAKYERYVNDLVRNECANRGTQPLRVSPWISRPSLLRTIRNAKPRTGPYMP